MLLIPLIWLLTVTFTAGVQKIWHPDPRIGFLAQAKSLEDKINFPGSPAQSVDPKWLAEKAAQIPAWKTLRHNNLLDAGVAGMFLVLVSIIIVISLREWFLLLSRRKPAVLHETEPVWLPDYAVKETGPNLRSAAGAAAIALGLARELSGETHFERAKQTVCACENHSDQKVFAQVTDEKFKGVRRCC